jgi:hypothetical protein
LRAAVRLDRAFHIALVVVNKEARRNEIGLALLLQAFELDRARDCIARAAAELALIVNDARTLTPQVDSSRQRLHARYRRCI